MERLLNMNADSFGGLSRGVVFLYDRTHWFTEKEAWAIYRLFAFAEAVGWTLLIGAIAYRGFGLPGYEIAISLAGKTHGILFVLYFVFTLLTARSLGWGFWRVAGSMAAGVGPYTSVIYERWMAYLRKRRPMHVAPPTGAED